MGILGFIGERETTSYWLVGPRDCVRLCRAVLVRGIVKLVRGKRLPKKILRTLLKASPYLILHYFMLRGSDVARLCHETYTFLQRRSTHRDLVRYMDLKIWHLKL